MIAAARTLPPLRRTVHLAVLALVTVLGLAGCRNPFLPAQPELPSSGGGDVTVPTDFSSPKAVLSTIGAAIFAKHDGIAAYMAALADPSTQGVDLTIDFDPDVVAERTTAGVPIPDQIWNRDLEQDFFNYLVDLIPGEYQLSFHDTGQDLSDAPDHWVLYRSYSITATAEGGFPVTNVASGVATIEMRRITAAPERWVITRWTDRIDPVAGADPNDPGLRCFSRLRIDSYNVVHTQ